VVAELAGELSDGWPSASTTIARTTEPSLVVRRRNGCGLGDGRMRDERRLDLEGSDPVTGGDDDVVVSALEPEVAVLVLSTWSPVPTTRRRRAAPRCSG
jgi:hypothetical protein